MDDHSNAELVSVIDRQLTLLGRIYSSIESAMERDVPLLGRTEGAAVLVAGLVEDYYTCVETAFQKISEHVESRLEPATWPTEMLMKLTLRLEGSPPLPVSEGNHGALLELRQIRHFSRHRFQPGNKWGRLDLILQKLETAHPMAVADLERFGEFVRGL
jgi:hypothetical protein